MGFSGIEVLKPSYFTAMVTAAACTFASLSRPPSAAQCQVDFRSVAALNQGHHEDAKRHSERCWLWMHGTSTSMTHDPICPTSIVLKP